MLTLLLFLLVLSTLVLIHELGHFLAARFFGVKAEEFGFGFPPRAIGFVKDKGKWKRVSGNDTKEYANTIWSLNWLPLGGFVRMKGEEGLAMDNDSFNSKPKYARAIILAAGVIMNWFLACLILTVGLIAGVRGDLNGLPSYAQVSDRAIEFVNVLPGSAAADADIRLGDHLLRVDGREATSVEQAQTVIKEEAARVDLMQVEVQRGNETKTLAVTPKLIESLGYKGIGVAMADTGKISFPWYRAVPEGIALTARYTWLIVSGFFGLIHNIFVGKSVGADVSGPVGIAVMTGKIAAQGIWPLLQFAALLSLNLAVINFLPIPALDGGRFLFLAIEAVRGKKASLKLEARIHQVGFFFLIGLVLLVTVRNLGQYGSTILNGTKHLI
jgi:regulator of sigma E protease